MKKCSIDTFLKALVSPFVPVAQSEAEVEAFPYAVFEQTVTPSYTKDGPYKYTAQGQVVVYDEDYDAADAIADDILDALSTASDEEYTVIYSSGTKDRVDALWGITINYTIIQKI